MARKFVINDGDLILGQVELHEDLVKHRDRSKTVGGGYWYNHRETKTIYFYGKSIDFGQVTKEQFDNSFKQPSVEDSNVVFTHESDISHYLL